MKAIDKLKKHLPQFEWSQDDKHSSIFGVITAPTTKKRISNDLYHLNNVYVFISSKMGGTPDNPPFRYAMCYQKGNVRPYRKKIWGGVEFNKVFVSGKDLDATINKLIESIDLNRYYLPK